MEQPAVDVSALVVLLALSAASAPAFGNDETYGGRGADLAPLHETKVRVASEDVLLELEGVSDSWQVTATYHLVNPTKETLTLQLAFPEDRCADDRDCSPNAGMFQDMNTTVRGVPVEAREGKVSASDSAGWADHLGRVFLYDLKFAPGETVEVVHTYRYDRSSGVDWWSTRYLTRTGARWGGPIGSARFTVRMPRPVWYAIYPKAFAITRFAETPRPSGGGTTTELVFEVKNWTPAVDFSVTFPAESISAWVGEGLCNGWQGDLSDEELTPILRELPSAQLRACRNHVYGLHGYVFQDAALRKQYDERVFPLPDWADAATYAIATRPTNPAFAPAWFTPGEAAYIQAVTKEEARRAGH